jgi:hypothetical protein
MKTNGMKMSFLTLQKVCTAGKKFDFDNIPLDEEEKIRRECESIMIRMGYQEKKKSAY